MKKILLPVSIVAILGASMASAYDLTINGETVADFEGASFSFSGDTLVLLAPNYTFPNPGDGGGDTGDGGGDTGDGGGDTGDGGGDTGDCGGDTGDGGGGDPGTDLCADLPSNIVCDTSIPADALATAQDTVTRVTVPRNKTIASAFSASGTSEAKGAFVWITPSGKKSYNTLAWISLTPGGEALSNRCDVGPSNLTFYITYALNNDSSRVCSLTPGADYFLNVKHDNATDPAGTFNQKVLTSTL